MPAVRQLWQLCRERGVVPALLVVPDWHGTAPIESDAECLDWLHGAVRDGAEVILHGERHDEVGHPRRPGDELRAWGRTAREGECLTLSASELCALVGRGLSRLRHLGFSPLGFVPPAWLMRPGARAGAYEGGAAFVEDEAAIRFADGRQVRAPVVRWSARTPVRAQLSVLVANWRWRVQRGEATMRLALHPGDARHPAVLQSVRDALVQWTSRGDVATYRSFTA
jgi:predicted deacetylase